MRKNKLKFYVLGASGFMGSLFRDFLRDRGYEVLGERVEITDLPLLKKKFKEARPDIVINFAGARAYPTVDWCEDNKEGTVAANVLGATNVMLAAIEVSAYPIQIASGCIYSGGPEEPFAEDDPPNFFGSFYSRMRVVMQDTLKELPVLQLRIRMPLSRKPHPRNLINKLASYKRVVSVANSVTLVEDIFPAIEQLSKIRPIGILNLVNEGFITHEDILLAYKKIIDPRLKYEIISTEELEREITKAKRSNCVLSTVKAKSLGIKMPALDKTRLEQVMLDYKNSK